ncbi:hypothetical protein BGZ65_012103, partial [Modicella reniformis]
MTPIIVGPVFETTLGECVSYPALEPYHIEFLGDYGIGMDMYHVLESTPSASAAAAAAAAAAFPATSFATGRWVGVELDEPKGKNSGVVEGKRYFECRTNHGVFVRNSQARTVAEGPARAAQ